MSYLGHRYEFRLMSVNKSTILDFDAFGDELAKDIEGFSGNATVYRAGLCMPYTSVKRILQISSCLLKRSGTG